MIIHNVRLANKRRVDIFITDGKITNILAPVIPNAADMINNSYVDATGLYVFPAGADLHVHSRTPGATHKEDWVHLVRAALRGGTATLACVGNNNPCWTTVRIIEEQHREVEEENLKANIFFWFTVTPDNLAELEFALEKPYVVGAKVFLGSGPQGAVIEDLEYLRRICEICRRHNKPLAMHTEVEAVMAKNRLILGHKPAVCDHGFIHDTKAEAAGVSVGIEACRKTGCTVIFFHLTCRRSIELALGAKATGLPVVIETCPQYFIFDESMTCGSGGGFYKINPALRAREEVGYVLSCLEEDKVNLVDSDHAPHAPGEKQGDEYDKILSGMPGAEERLTLVLDLVNRGFLSLEQAVRLTSTNATEILGLKKGRIEPGYDADLVLVDMNKKRRFSNASVESKCGWTAHHRRTYRGVPQATIIGGEVVWRAP